MDVKEMLAKKSEGEMASRKIAGFRHCLFIESRWTLKQGQGDEL